MYDPDRQSKPSLCSFSPQTLCTYLPHTHTLRTVSTKPHHYPQDSQISELIQTISRELFYYASSMQKANSKEEHFSVQNILLENIKKILVFNLDKHGLIMEQKLFYLVVSLIHSKHNGINNLRQLLNQTHHLLTSSLWHNPGELLPDSLVMLLNGQFEELMHYVKQELSTIHDQSLVETLVDLLAIKIQQAQSKSNTAITQSHMAKICSQVQKSNWLKLLITDLTKKNINTKIQVQKQSITLITQREPPTNIFNLFRTEQQTNVLLAVLSGNQQIIELLAKGSWAIYLNLYINFIENLSTTTSKKTSYENVIAGYLQKCLTSKIVGKKYNHQAEDRFLAKLLTTFNSHNRFSFHEIYQSTFSIFSPVLSHLIGLLMIDFKMIDGYSLANNPDCHQDILLGLVDNCNKISWTALVHMIGFVHNSPVFKDQHSKQAMWQNLMFQHLPYEIDSHTLSIPSQIKQIEQKLEDLTLIGLSNFTQTYLTTLFNLHLTQTTSLSETILQLFFLTLQMSDSPNANHCFHQMKLFVSQYYRTKHFDYQLIECLEGIFQRKQGILSEKMETKVQKLFCLVYKIQRVYQIDVVGEQTNQTGPNVLKQIVLKQLLEFNKLFHSTKVTKPISLSIELLRLAAYLHSRTQNILNIGAPTLPESSPDSVQSQLVLNTVRQFHWNIDRYLNQWKLAKLQHGEHSDEAEDELEYFDKYFY